MPSLATFQGIALGDHAMVPEESLLAVPDVEHELEGDHRVYTPYSMQYYAGLARIRICI